MEPALDALDLALGFFVGCGRLLVLARCRLFAAAFGTRLAAEPPTMP